MAWMVGTLECDEGTVRDSLDNTLTREWRAAIRCCCDVSSVSRHGKQGLHMIMGGELSLDGNEDIIHHYMKQ